MVRWQEDGFGDGRGKGMDERRHVWRRFSERRHFENKGLRSAGLAGMLEETGKGGVASGGGG